jgi:hypothetical protein
MAVPGSQPFLSDGALERRQPVLDLANCVVRHEEPDAEIRSAVLGPKAHAVSELALAKDRPFFRAVWP